MSHTPAPWIAGHQASGDWLIQTDPSSHLPPWAVQDGTIAAIRGGEQAEANARLIAAAPELLAALRHLLRYDFGDSDGAKEARAAVAKAEAA